MLLSQSYEGSDLLPSYDSVRFSRLGLTDGNNRLLKVRHQYVAAVLVHKMIFLIVKLIFSLTRLHPL